MTDEQRRLLDTINDLRSKLDPETVRKIENTCALPLPSEREWSVGPPPASKAPRPDPEFEAIKMIVVALVGAIAKGQPDPQGWINQLAILCAAAEVQYGPADSKEFRDLVIDRVINILSGLKNFPAPAQAQSS